MNNIEEQATGCIGAGNYRDYAKQNGFTRIEVLDWTSSAGDWQFLVTKDGQSWQVLFQENNYPRPGFSYSIDPRIWEGSLEDVYQQIEDYCN